MDQFTTLEPVRLYASASSGSQKGSAKPKIFAPPPRPIIPLIGRLPIDLHVLTLSYIAVPDIPSYARACRALGGLAREERVWKRRWDSFGVERFGLGDVVDTLEAGPSTKRDGAPPTLAVDIVDDEFGDFASGVGGDSFLGQHQQQRQTQARLNQEFSVGTAFLPPPTYRQMYIRVHKLLIPLLAALSSPPHLILSTLFPSIPNTEPDITYQSRLLHLLALFLSSSVKPMRTWGILSSYLRSAMDRFDASLLTAFDVADSRKDEPSMKIVARSSWEVWDAKSGEWEMGRVWSEKRGLFYEAEGRGRPLDNFTKSNTLVFDPMDAFLAFVLDEVRREGSIAVRVFPSQSRVLLAFAERVATEVIGEYITPLLTRAREISNDAYLRATAACFREAWRLVDLIVEIGGSALHNGAVVNGTSKRPASLGTGLHVSRNQAEEVIYTMFSLNMDEYLDEEIDSLRATFESVCTGWDKQVRFQHSRPGGGRGSLDLPTSPTRTGFLQSSNPAQMKRTVLASFTNVLLLPVTIVPRTFDAVGTALTKGGAVLTTGGVKTVGKVGAAIGAGGTAAVQGIAMLNPQRWVGGGGGPDLKAQGYSHSLGLEDFELAEEEEDEEGEFVGGGVESVVVEQSQMGGQGEEGEENVWGDVQVVAPAALSASVSERKSVEKAKPTSLGVPSSPNTSTSTTTSTQTSAQTTRATTPNPAVQNRFDTLLSLDITLELIHASRSSLKRLETFTSYPAPYGAKVHDTIEEVFILLLDVLSDRHLKAGFERATEQMKTYKPILPSTPSTPSPSTTSFSSSSPDQGQEQEQTGLAPLMQFFELVHVGDTIQMMVQVYYDKEISPHIDRTDFFNPVVRAKKQFENVLDDSVAAGLNAGTEVLMNQVDFIIQRYTLPRQYYPDEKEEVDLRPTRGCMEAIKCLDMHCKMLKGSGGVGKEVLEVWCREVGIRLVGILHKHLKRQIISLQGGFQVIADLNAYYDFVASLRVPQITSEFSHLKMLGHVYVVEDAKDLAQIVRDVTRYGGAYRPEDIYEFIQRRADWKKIEKVVDKTMYNLSFKEDCVVC